MAGISEFRVTAKHAAVFAGEGFTPPLKMLSSLAEYGDGSMSGLSVRAELSVPHLQGSWQCPGGTGSPGPEGTPAGSLSSWPYGPPKMMKTQLWRAANLGRSRLLAGVGRLKGGCGHDCPPSSVFSTVSARKPS
jgi:hypothetical protein